MKKSVPKLRYWSMVRHLLWTLAAFLQFLILYRVGRTPWMGDQPVARPLHTHRINIHRHPCLKWDSNPWFQCSSERRQFLPQTVRPLWPADWDIRSVPYIIFLQSDQPLCEPTFETGTSSVRSNSAPHPTSEFRRSADYRIRRFADCGVTRGYRDWEFLMM
jgi:hypothetical protein